MESIKNQLIEDLKLIQTDWGYIDTNLKKDEFAFNYWILSRLYSIDEQLIPSLITEYNDKNIDCFVHFEETKELFILQNKFYSEETPLAREKASDFLTTPISILNEGKYTRSKDLQKAFDKAKKDPDYKIWLHMYVSNTKISDEGDVPLLFKQFQCNVPDIKAYVGAELFDLKSIKDIYYGKRYRNQKKFTYILNTKNKATSLNILPEEYNLPEMLRSHYIMTPIFELYDMYRKAEKSDYPLFEENIREYLGTKGINNGIIKTLKNKAERTRFFYYNNGITIICEGAGKKSNNNSYSIELTNPQIVNGCQTINSINEVLSSVNEELIKEEFKDTYVMTKVLVFDNELEDNQRLYKDIVKYTNTQNSINEKAFASNNEYFENLKVEFRKRGLLLSVKPSDTNKFLDEYEDKYKLAELKKMSSELFSFFELPNGKTSDFIIPLEKLLQVLLAFVEDGYIAFTKKNHVLKRNSKIYDDYSMKYHDYLSFDNMIRLYFLYKKAEEDKKLSQDKKTPIPYYMIDYVGSVSSIGEYGKTADKLDQLFCDKDNFNKIYSFMSKLTSQYRSEYYSKYSFEYNEMIKKEIDKDIVEKNIKNGLMFTDFEAIKKFF